MHELGTFICKAFEGDAIVKLLRALNNAADEVFQLARRVRIEKEAFDFSIV